jgi:hypothetical protein
MVLLPKDLRQALCAHPAHILRTGLRHGSMRALLDATYRAPSPELAFLAVLAS